MAEGDWGQLVEDQIKHGVSGLKVTDDGPPGVIDDPGDVETTKAEASLLTKILRTKLIDNTNDVEVLRNDPSSPLYSAKSFEELRL